MKMKHLFLSGLLLASTISIFPNAMNDQQEQINKPQWIEFWKNYLTSITSGAIIGSFTGYLSAKLISPLLKFTSKQTQEIAPFPLIISIVTLCAERGLRNNLVDATNDNFDKYSIKYHAGLMNDSAWLASWIAFLGNLHP